MHLTARATLFLALGAIVAAYPAQNRGTLSRLVPLPSGADFPLLDSDAWELQRRGLTTEVLRQRLAQAPGTPETLALLLDEQRGSLGVGHLDDVLDVVRHAVTDQPAVLARVFSILAAHSHDFWGDDAQGHLEVLQELITETRSVLPTLPEGQAARTELRLVTLEARLRMGEGPDYYDELRAFIEEYDGTDAAMLARIDLISAKEDAGQRLAAYDQFVAEHPHTEAAAKSLFAKGQQLRGYVRRGREPRDADPTERFMQVLGIVQELESGSYPSCEWVDRAGELIVRFWAPDEAEYSPRNLDRVLEVYRTFIGDHFEIEGPRPLDNGVGHVLTKKMVRLHELRGDGLAGIERDFDELAQTVGDGAEVRYLQALFYVERSEQVPADERATMVSRAVGTLEALARRQDGSRDGHPIARKAQATLASLYFYEGDLPNALARYREYLGAYPDSDWAWVAALRIGQSYEGLDDLEAALVAYRSATVAPDSLAPAQVLGHALAARAATALGRLDAALDEYRLALAAWDHDFGPQYSIFARRISADARRIETWDQPRLAAWIAVLHQSLSSPGGVSLERGRWLLERERRVEARRVLDTFVAEDPASPLAAEARYLAHRAWLEQTLEAAGAENHEEALPRLLDALDAIAHDNWDPAVGAAKIARASILWIRGETDRAEALMGEALREWNERQYDATVAPAPLSQAGVEEDVAEIRALLFLPQGGGVFGKEGWNGFSWPEEPSPFIVVDPHVTVQLFNLDRLDVTVSGELPGLHNVLFLTAEQRRLLNKIMNEVGGTATREPRWIMETPNQPVGLSLSILELWKKFFPARQGHWFGWVFQTYPIIRQIDFLDESRTEARAYVTIGYAGATVVLEKKDGAWTAVRLTEQWVT